MAEALAFEKTDELGKPIKRLNKTAPSGASGSSRRRAAKKQRIVPTVVVVSSDSDDDDTDFVATELATEPDDSEYDSASSGVWPNEFEEVFPSNAEVRYDLLCSISFLTILVGCRHSPSQDDTYDGAACCSKAHALLRVQDVGEVS
jgi:hypothetical protein